MSRSLLVIAGEVSGDMHAARVVRELQKRDPSMKFWGAGGSGLRECGMEILYDVKDMAVMGLAEVLRRYGFFKQTFAHLLDEAVQRKPDAVLLVDYPGFNLRFAEQAKKAGLKVIYYICPQVWAWHRSRIKKIAQIVDHLLVIFPFEVDVFKDTGLRVDFVGHPLAEAEQGTADGIPWQGSPRLALLPGSRRQEIHRILPAMLGAVELLKKDHPNLSVVVACPTEQVAGWVNEFSGKRKALFTVVTGKTRAVLRSARAALVKSGTSTIEAALAGCAMVLVYKTSWLTYTLGRLLVRVPHIGMVNIVAGRRIVPELIQQQATPKAVAAAVKPLLSHTAAFDKMKQELYEVEKLMGKGGAAARAAEMILSDLERDASCKK
ncbi:MAG: lipid-A-disaccharide synthase [Kiritimatiellia bacterium]